jgi:hypothetical protein
LLSGSSKSFQECDERSAIVLRIPRRRAIYHFINPETLTNTAASRVFGYVRGVGITLMVASAIVIKPAPGHIGFGVTEYGLRAAILCCPSGLSRDCEWP